MKRDMELVRLILLKLEEKDDPREWIKEFQLNGFLNSPPNFA